MDCPRFRQPKTKQKTKQKQSLQITIFHQYTASFASNIGSLPPKFVHFTTLRLYTAEVLLKESNGLRFSSLHLHFPARCSQNIWGPGPPVQLLGGQGAPPHFLRPCMAGVGTEEYCQLQRLLFP